MKRLPPASRYDIVCPTVGCKHINRFRNNGLHEATYWHDKWPCLPTGSLHPVVPTTHRSARRATEAIAWYFKREFGYDFVQYAADEDGHPKDAIFLITTGDYPLFGVGAVCFRWREYKDHEPVAGLSWVWLHPFLRRQGILRAAWPYFRSRLGDFVVESPLSKAMDAFLFSLKECWLCGRKKNCKYCENEGK